MLVGGVFGSFTGIAIFRLLTKIGQVDLMISIVYVVFLSIIGAMMLTESLRAIMAARRGAPLSGNRGGQHSWIHGLPFKMRFRRSKLYISLIPPVLIGFFVGMIYLLRMPTSVVIGTSLFQIVFVSALTGVMHSVENQAVDAMLGLLLVAGGVVGAQYGVRAAAKLQGEQLRAMLAIIVLLMGLRLGWDLVTPPADLYSITDAIPHS